MKSVSMKQLFSAALILLASSFSAYTYSDSKDAGDALNLNTATAQELAANLKGIGPVRAEAIVQYREKHGDFESVDHLARVPGIPEKIVDQNREKLTTDSSIG